MDEMKIIHHKEFGSLNVAVINEKEYFPAVACAKALGYTNPRQAILNHCKGGHELRLPTNGGTQKVKYISEGDLYRLIVHSRLPSAERFEKWVFDEVLPDIRKNGVYSISALENIPEIVAGEVKEILPQILKEIAPEMGGRKKKPNRAHGKIDKLPKEIREKVIYMLYVEKDTYEEIQLFLNRSGYSVHLSSIGRFNRRIEDETSYFFNERR